MEDLKNSDSIQSNGDEFDGKLVLRHKDDTPEFDLNNQEDRQRLIDLAQKGYGAEKTWTEAKQIKQVLDAWNSELEAAKNDDAALNALRTKIEGYIGRPLTSNEQAEFEDDEFMDESTKKLMSTVNDLQKELRLIKESQKIERETKEARALEAQAKSVADKYNAKKGYPHVTPQELIEYGSEKGIFDFEAAYRDMNFQKLIDLEVEGRTGKRQQKQSARKEAFAEGEGSFEQISPDLQKKFAKMSSTERANLIAEELARKGLSLVDE